MELVEALARMVNRVIQHGKAEAQSALGSIEEIRTTLAEVANLDDFLRTSTRRSGRYACICRREPRPMAAAQEGVAGLISSARTSGTPTW